MRSFIALFTSLLCFAIHSHLVHSQLIGPVGPTTSLDHKQRECNILHYGAIADNKTDVSTALHAAFDQCVRKAPGSRLVVPPGNYLLKQGVVLSNGTNWALQLDGLITAAYGGNWTIERSLILQGFAGVAALNSTINGEGDQRFLLNVLVIVNGELRGIFLNGRSDMKVYMLMDLTAVNFEFYSSNGLGAIQGQGYLYRNANKYRSRENLSVRHLTNNSFQHRTA